MLVEAFAQARTLTYWPDELSVVMLVVTVAPEARLVKG